MDKILSYSVYSTLILLIGLLKTMLSVKNHNAFYCYFRAKARKTASEQQDQKRKNDKLSNSLPTHAI